VGRRIYPLPILVRRLGWLLSTLRDVGEAPGSVVKECMTSRKFPNYMELMSSIIDVEPSSFEEAIDQHVWWDAMVEEYTSIMRNGFWEIVPSQEGKSISSSKWPYKINHAIDGSIKKFKVRFVARGFTQKQGVNYEETFVPVTGYYFI
jgi:hypothetical protein